LALDPLGILMHLLRRLVEGPHFYLHPAKEPMRGPGVRRLMPLGRLGAVWRASVSFFEPMGSIKSLRIYKRFHDAVATEMPWQRRYIERSRGRYRDWMMRLPYVPAERVVFYFYGDLERVLKLLEHLPALGKKADIGFGMYRSVSVEELDEDRSVVWEGRAMRPLTLMMLEWAEETMMTAYNPPYWDKRTVAECAVPGSRVLLKPRWRERLSTS